MHTINSSTQDAGQLEPLITSDNDEEIYKDEPLSKWTLLATIVLGSGCSWLLIDGLWVELPYFQQYTSEDTFLASEMTVAAASSGILIIPVYIFIDRGWNINYKALIYILILIQLSACLVVAFLWRITVAHSSVIILLTAFVGQFCACIQSVTIMSYLTSINNRLTAPLWLGANIGSMMSATLGLIQQPGSNDALFPPEIYYISWIPVYIASIIAFVFLDRTYLEQYSAKRSIAGSHNNNAWGIPVWWQEIWKYVALYSSITLITWVFVRAAIPFAVLSTSSPSTDDTENTQTEQYVITISLVGVVLGSVAALWVRIENDWYIWNVGLFYYLCVILYFWIALDRTGLWKWKGANIMVVMLVFAMRFSDGFIAPVMFANIDRRYPNCSLKMNQFMSFIATITMFLGVWISFFIIE